MYKCDPRNGDEDCKKHAAEGKTHCNNATKRCVNRKTYRNRTLLWNFPSPEELSMSTPKGPRSSQIPKPSFSPLPQAGPRSSQIPKPSFSPLPKTPVVYNYKDNPNVQLLKQRGFLRGSGVKKNSGGAGRVQNDTIKLLREENDEYRRQLRECKSAHDKCINQVKKYTSAAGSVRKEIEADKEEARILKEKINNARLELQKQNQENESLKVRIKGLLKDLEQEKNLVEREKLRVQGEVAREIDAARRAYELDKQKLEAARKQIELQRDEIIRDLEKRDRDLNKVRDDLIKENEQYLAAAADIKRMREELKDARAHVSCKQNIAQLQKSIKRSKGNVDDVDKLKQQLKVERAKLRQLRAVIKKAGGVNVNIKVAKPARAKPKKKPAAKPKAKPKAKQ